MCPGPLKVKSYFHAGVRREWCHYAWDFKLNLYYGNFIKCNDNFHNVSLNISITLSDIVKKYICPYRD